MVSLLVHGILGIVVIAVVVKLNPAIFKRVPDGSRARRRDAPNGPYVTFEPPHLLRYKALSGTPFPGYAGEVGLTEAGAGTRISYTVSSTAGLPLVRAPLAVLCQVLLRMLARAATKRS